LGTSASNCPHRAKVAATERGLKSFIYPPSLGHPFALLSKKESSEQ